MSSTSFLNTFTENAELKISKISNKITELEILLAVLEAKLNSVPGLDVQEEEPSSIPTATTPTVQTETSESEARSDTAAPSVSAEDRSKYAEFEKMLKVGVPSFVVEAKMAAAGLDPGMLQLFER